MTLWAVPSQATPFAGVLGSSRASTCVVDVFASRAGGGSVRFQANSARRPYPRVKCVRDVAAGPEVHLIRRLTLEGGVGKAGIVLFDVEGDRVDDVVPRRKVQSVVKDSSAVSLEQPGEELVREVADVVVASSIASHERFRGAVVGFTQVAQCLFSFRVDSPRAARI
jgi:hypothetical protein